MCREGGTVGHWRIVAEKISKGPAVLVIEGIPYQSFYDIVKIHQIKPLKSTVEEGLQVLLTEPADRTTTMK